MGILLAINVHIVWSPYPGPGSSVASGLHLAHGAQARFHLLGEIPAGEILEGRWHCCNSCSAEWGTEAQQGPAPGLWVTEKTLPTSLSLSITVITVTATVYHRTISPTPEAQYLT